MKLYDCSTAPSPRRVRIFAAEKGIDIDLVPVDLRSGEQFSEEFQAINPDCVVPVLELDDGTHLSEVIAICQYLEDVYPEPTLFGSNASERARATMWNAIVESQGLWATADAYRNFAKGLQGHALPGPQKYEQIPELAERSRRRVIEFMARLDGHLENKEYLAGDRFTVADITAMVTIDFATRLKMGIDDEASNLLRWYNAVAARPSASA